MSEGKTKPGVESHGLSLHMVLSQLCCKTSFCSGTEQAFSSVEEAKKSYLPTGQVLILEIFPALV